MCPGRGSWNVATAHQLEVLCSLPLRYCNCYWVGSPFGVPGSGLTKKIAIRHTPQISVRVIADIFVLIPRFSSPSTSVTIKNWDGWPCQASDFHLKKIVYLFTSCAGISSFISVRFMPKDWIFFALPRWLGLEIGGNNLIHHHSAQNFIPTCLGANHGIWAGWDHRPEPEWPKCFRQGSVSEGHVTRLPDNINNLLPQFHQQSSFIADCDSYSARQCRSFWGGLKLPSPLAAFHWRRAVARCRQHNCPRIRLTLAVSSTKTPYWSSDPTAPHVRNVSDIPIIPLRGGPHGSVIRCSIIPINWMIGASWELLQGLLSKGPVAGGKLGEHCLPSCSPCVSGKMRPQRLRDHSQSTCLEISKPGRDSNCLN